MSIKYLFVALESYNSAKAKYRGVGKITDHVFESLVEADPTKTKKYLEWFCREFDSIIDYNQTHSMTWSTLTDIVNKFNKATKSKGFEMESNDIYKYTFLDVISLLGRFANYSLHDTKKAKKAGAEKLYENDKCSIYYIKTKEACMLYGAHTEWCITEKGKSYWENYNTYNFFFFLISKTGEEKLAFAIPFAYPDSPIQVFNENDNPIYSYVSFVEKYYVSWSIMEKLIQEKLKNKSQEAIDKFITANNLTKNEDGTYSCAYSNDIRILPNLIDSDGKLIIKFKKIAGDFDITRVGLRSLEGCPEEVGGTFVCSSNYNLKSLRGGPKKVGGSYFCQDCNLTSLLGSPKEIKGEFAFYHNRVRSLAHIPKSWGSKLRIQSDKLVSLKGLPSEESSSIEIIGCDNLTSLKGLPKKINGSLFLTNLPNVTTLEGMPKKVTDFVFISELHELQNLDGLPDYIGTNHSKPSNSMGLLVAANNKLEWLNCPNTHINGSFTLKYLSKLKSLANGPAEVNGPYNCNEIRSVPSLDGITVTGVTQLELYFMYNLETFSYEKEIVLPKTILIDDTTLTDNPGLEDEVTQLKDLGYKINTGTF